ncbi:hypothetical protein, partial [Nocardioides sp. NPDC006303]|uniref:hypothetical protein n=1 Tax=Nocardioides sp. NPDC006303 TaxID=3156747 RepID=UPI0033ADBF3B
MPSLFERAETSLPERFARGLVWAADPFLEGLLDEPRSQGRPSAAGFAGRFAVLDTAAPRAKIIYV